MFARLTKGAAQCRVSGRVVSAPLGGSILRVLPPVAVQSTVRRTFCNIVRQQQGAQAFIQPSEQRVHDLMNRLDVDRSVSFEDLDTKFQVLCAIEKEFAFAVRHADLHRIYDVGSLVSYVAEREAARAAAAEAEAMHWTRIVPSNVTLKLQRAPTSELEYEEGDLDEGGMRAEQQEESGDGDGDAAAEDDEEEEEETAEETAPLGNDARRSVLMPRPRRRRAWRRGHSKSGNRKL